MDTKAELIKEKLVAYCRSKGKYFKNLEKKHLPSFTDQACYKGNGIYSIANLFSTDTRELFLMFIAQQEQVTYEKEELSETEE